MILHLFSAIAFVEAALEAAETGFVRCENCDSQEDTKDLDFIGNIKAAKDQLLHATLSLNSTGRYFIFHFASGLARGNHLIWTEGGRFPTTNFILDVIAKESGLKTDEIVITGWTEFKSEQDFNDYRSASNHQEIEQG